MNSGNPNDETLPQGNQESNASDATRDASSSLGRKLSLQPTNSIGEQIGPYRVLEEISRGGMGVVYLAQQQEPIRRRVALKVIKHEGGTSELLKRFDAERQALAKMQHPCIATIFDGGTTSSGFPYFVMELIDGLPLSKYCETHSLTVEERLQLFVGVCRAIEHAHEKSIVHRDLKPSNVMVAMRDGKPIPKVIDFGLAKVLSESTDTAATGLTEQGRVMGTYQYMSPEQAAGKEVTPRTDIYSLGVMLYEILCGSTPIESSALSEHGLLAVLQMIQDHSPPKPSDRLSKSRSNLSKTSDSNADSYAELKSALTGELDWVVMKSLEKDPQDRYASARELADDIDRYLRNEPVLARPPSISYRIRKFVKRNRSKVALLGSVAAAVLLVLIGLPILFSARRSARIAEISRELQIDPSLMEFSAEEFESQDALLDELRVLDLAVAADETESLVERTLSGLSRAILQPRITETRRQQLENAISRVQAWESAAEQQLRLTELKTQIAEMRGQWMSVFNEDQNDLKALAGLFPEETVRTGTRGVHTIAERSPVQRVESIGDAPMHTAPFTPTRYVYNSDVRVEAVFEDWELSHEVGLSLGTLGDQGYDFVLRSQIGSNFTEESATVGRSEFIDLIPMRESRRLGTFLVEIRRNSAPLLRHEISADSIPSRPIRILASREGNELSVQINSEKRHQILDPFPLGHSKEGLIGLRSVPSVTLQSLFCDAKKASSFGTPLQMGDDLFSADELLPAMEAYERQKLLSDDVDIQLECEYKSAICKLAMGRRAEAMRALQTVQSSGHPTWAPLAAIALWDEAAKVGDAEAQENAYDMIDAMDALERVAALISEETKERIVNANFNFLTIGSLLRVDPDRLSKVRRAAELDRLLSYDGKGKIANQFELTRMLRFYGHQEEALALLRELSKRSSSTLIQKSLFRTLRLTGRSAESIALIDQELSKTESPNPWLYHGRAQANYALGRFGLAARDIEAALTLFKTTGANDTSLEVNLYLMRGFLRLRAGKATAALEDWRTGYLKYRQAFVVNSQANKSELIGLMICGGLSNELLPEDSERFVQLILADAGASSFGSVMSFVDVQTPHRVFTRMWKSPYGKRWAESIAFENIDFKSRTLGPIFVAGIDFLSHGAFGDSPSTADTQIVEQCVQQGVELWLEKGMLTNVQALQIGMAWKGVGILGPANLPADLPPAFLARIAYVSGQKKLRDGDIRTAKRLFEQAKVCSSSAESVYELSQHTLELLEAEVGELALHWAGDASTRVLIRTKDGAEVQTLDLAGQSVVTLPPGEYALEANNGAWNRATKVVMGQANQQEIDWNWKPAEYPTSNFGLLSHPAQMDAAWQLVRSHGAAEFSDVTWNPDGSEVAVVTDDNVVRIVDAQTRLVTRMLVGGPHRIKSVDWSPDGRTIAVGDIAGAMYLIDPNDGSILKFLYQGESEVRLLRWNPDGTRIALLRRDKTALVNPADANIQELAPESSYWGQGICWNRDGTRLATATSREVVVWDLNTSKPQHILPNYQSVAWLDEPNHIAVASSTELALYDLDTHLQLAQALLPRETPVCDMTWDSQSQTIEAVSANQGLYTWHPLLNSGSPPEYIDTWGRVRIRKNASNDIRLMGSGGGCTLLNSGVSHYISQGKALFLLSSSRKGKRVAFVVQSWGSIDNRLQTIDLETGKSATAKAIGTWKQTAWHPTLDIIAATTAENQLWIGDGELNELTTLELGESSVSGLQWSHSGKNVFVFDSTGKVTRCPVTVADRSSVKSIEFGEPRVVLDHARPIVSMDISPDESSVAIADQTLSLNVYAFDDGTVQVTYRAVNADSPWLRFSPNGEFLVSASWDRIQVWSLSTGHLHTLKVPGHLPTGIDWIDNQRFIFCTHAGDLHVFDLSDKSDRLVCPAGEWLMNVQYTESGRVMATSQTGIVREIDITNGRTEAVAVAMINQSVACFATGGSLRSNRETLEGLSCIVTTQDGQKLLPASEFFERYAMPTAEQISN